MIHEFAVDPELLVEWSKTSGSYAYFANNFGLGEPRILSQYPHEWKKLALECWEAHAAKATTEAELGNLETQRERFTALFFKLTEVTVKRPTSLAYTHMRTWLDNALGHAPIPLQCVLARCAPVAHACVLVGDGIVEHARWKLDKTVSVPRDALGAAVAPLLTCCTEIVFVDPYFNPSRAAHVNSFRAFIDALTSRVGLERPVRIEVLTSLSGDTRPSWAFFRSGCEKFMRPLLPVGWEMKFVEVNDVGSRGEKLHNRYILTDLGGIFFGVGLDSGAATEADDLGVMSRTQYDKRWDQYAGPTPEFAVVGTNEVTLKREAAKPPTLARPGQGRARGRFP